MTGNFYISGEVSVSVMLISKIAGIEMVGTGTLLTSTKNGGGFVMSQSAAPTILLAGGAIKISLASIAQSTSNMYFNYVSDRDFTIALGATLNLNPGDFLGAIASWRGAALRQRLGSAVSCTCPCPQRWNPCWRHPTPSLAYGSTSAWPLAGWLAGWPAS